MIYSRHWVPVDDFVLTLVTCCLLDEALRIRKNIYAWKLSLMDNLILAREMWTSNATWFYLNLPHFLMHDCTKIAMTHMSVLTPVLHPLRLPLSCLSPCLRFSLLCECFTWLFLPTCIFSNPMHACVAYHALQLSKFCFLPAILILSDMSCNLTTCIWTLHALPPPKCCVPWVIIITDSHGQ